jgi:N-acetylglucosamine-6-sulfatase
VVYPTGTRQEREWLSVLIAVAVGLIVAGCAAKAQEVTQKPNIIFVLTDDQDGGTIQYMPTVQDELVKKGTTFENGILTTPNCCPSRATMLRGQYTHNHGIFRESTGAQGFRQSGLEKSTVATWLDNAGYKTALLGKYLNGYARYRYVPPGWDRWYANVGQDVWSECLNENGKERCYGSKHPDSILAAKAEGFIRSNTADPEPLFLWLSFNAPHEPALHARQDRTKFSDTPLPRPPSFNEADVSDKPSWVRSRPLLSGRPIRNHTAFYRDRLRSLQTVDRAVGRLVGALADTGRLNNTYVVFWTDNGHHIGEHRLGALGGTPGKGTPYVEDTRVPLIVRGPSVPQAQRRQELVLNTDIAPTFAELGGAQVPDFVDGRSFVPLLRGQTPPWRTVALIENAMSEKLHMSANAGMITEDTAYVEYENDERELYNLQADPYQLHNTYEDAKDTDPALIAELEARLEALRSCEGEACRRAENGSGP